jgi:hypothetical protein
MTTECAREQDVLDTLAANRWPDRCEPELAAHVRTCEMCSDLAVAAAALLDEHDHSWSEARVPSAAVVWWRAQLSGREEAARAAARPIGFVQGVAASCAVWIAVSLLRTFPPAASHWRTSLARLVNSLPDLGALAGAVPGGAPVLILAAASLLLLWPLALFLALREE